MEKGAEVKQGRPSPGEDMQGRDGIYDLCLLSECYSIYNDMEMPLNILSVHYDCKKTALSCVEDSVATITSTILILYLALSSGASHIKRNSRTLSRSVGLRQILLTEHMLEFEMRIGKLECTAEVRDL